jgi:hypothetical protein
MVANPRYHADHHPDIRHRAAKAPRYNYDAAVIIRTDSARA